MSYRVARHQVSLLASISTVALIPATGASAQGAGFQTTDELIVYGTVVTRNRSETVAPVLSYDLEYFQRFEPISAGDALKRVPGVSFSSDVLEYDRMQLRGLPAIYSQVQINGQLMTGGGNDRVFAVDRIPAELIDSVEIIRSPSADVSSEQIAGAANINLKKAGTIKGGWVRGSGFGVEGDELRGAGSVGYGDTIGDTSYLVSLDVQQRRNPKVKSARVFEFDPDLVPNAIVDQDDTRDGTDYAFNGEIAQKLGDGLLRLYGFYVYTDRQETEFTRAFDVDGDFNRTDLNQVENQLEDIQQQNLNIVGDYRVPVGKGEAQVLFGYNLFRDDLDTSEDSTEVGEDTELQFEFIDTKDQDWFGTLAYTANLNELVTIKFGVDGRVKTRDFNQIILVGDIGDDLEEEPGLGAFDLEERRVDPYIKANWNLLPNLTVETGVRYELTDRDISGPGFDGRSADFGELNPSAHIRYGLTDTTMLRFSVARTVLRPGFDQLTPAVLLEEPTGRFATEGNPDLAQETAWGIDVGFDQKIGDRGILGFNFFNRNIKDKIELAGTGRTTAFPAGDEPCEDLNEDPAQCEILTFLNLGDARAYGIEVDIDTPLTMIGLPNTTIFANYTWMETEVTDPVTGRKRAFNDQPDYILNLGFIHSLPEWNSSFGVNYQQRGDSLEFVYDEITKLSYEGNLEAFWETRIGTSTVLRFTGANLLDAEKVENVQVYDPDLTGDLVEGEVERERSGRLFLMTVRQAF
jgi:outer membrane receptor protein involved in Fe transport